MAKNAEAGTKFKIAFSKLMLHIALDQVRVTYELLLRDLSRFEHKANVKKLRGEKLKTDVNNYTYFIYLLYVATAAQKKGITLDQKAQTSLLGALGKFAFYAASFGAITVATMGGVVTGVLGSAYGLTLANEWLNQNYNDQKAEIQALQLKINTQTNTSETNTQKILDEFSLAYKAIFKMNSFRKMLVIMSRDYKK